MDEVRSNALARSSAVDQIQRTLGGAWNRTVRHLSRRRALEAVEQLPVAMQLAARWAVTREATDEESELAARIERIRAEVASLEVPTITSFSSPVPGFFELDDQGRARPGPQVSSPPADHSTTGSAPPKGLLLLRLAEGSEAQRILELGSNTGMSASYLASSRHCKELTTVEGSPELAKIAAMVIGRFSPDARVQCTLFDDALDSLLHDRPFDLAFLDGQHEGAALIHYAHRLIQILRPGGVLVLDDIYWSKDMNNAWRSLIAAGVFSITVDFGALGVGVIGPEPPRHYDFVRFLGRPLIPRRVGDRGSR